VPVLCCAERLADARKTERKKRFVVLFIEPPQGWFQYNGAVAHACCIQL
jgi:hypothetical protein